MSHHDPLAMINELIRGTIVRATGESMGGTVVLAVATFVLSNALPWSLEFYGGITLLVATGLNTGIAWSFVLTKKLLVDHPPSDARFWMTTFATQARLVHLIPIWSCLPFTVGIGICLYSYWISSKLTPVFALYGIMTIGVIVLIPILNLKVVSKLKSNSQAFREIQGAG